MAKLRLSGKLKKNWCAFGSASLKIHITLCHLWPTEPKINRDHVLLQTTHPAKYEGSAINGSQVNERKTILHKWTLWPWPLTYWTKVSRDHILIKTNHHVKYEGSVINGSQDIERKPILHKRTMWPWPLTWTQNQ